MRKATKESSQKTVKNVTQAKDKKIGKEDDEVITGSVNIQTSAVLFEKVDHDVRSSMTGDDVFNFKQKKVQTITS